MDLQQLIRDVPDFPKPGILFRDIMPLLAHPQGLSTIVSRLSAQCPPVDYVVAIESRGFIIGAALALKLECGFIAVRKPKKLPGQLIKVEYSLEYGQDSLEMQSDILPAGAEVLIVDDVIATGGTAAATSRLVEKAGGKVKAYGFVVELTALQGRTQLNPHVPVISLVHY
ncbi:MAG: adenine phosphoribosyltransferase [Pseudanabaenaceae cyanobacterium SKYGB_i_bin29]|nr:adenine phosphoribosyltransferase [Pseudanabaenaceae cyanobacterium SKYG29]MDW8422404.1 adenine phosphoribosyltransferase [Pseudanabaenaceae cyanobacterium SKYGB_i_bin29]